MKRNPDLSANAAVQFPRLPDPETAGAEDDVLVLPTSEEWLAEENVLAVLMTVDYASDLVERMRYVRRLRQSDPAIRHLTRTGPLQRLRLVSLLGECNAPSVVRDSGQAIDQPALVRAAWAGWTGFPLEDLVLEVGDDHLRWRVWPKHAPRPLFTIDLEERFLRQYVDSKGS